MKGGGAQVKKNKLDDLEEIYLALAEPLYYYLLKLTGSPNVAEELVQETFYRATLSLDLYENEQVKSWLFKVARNAYMDQWRKRQRWKWVPFFDYLSNSKKFISPYGIPESKLLDEEISKEISDVMKVLPESYRSILYLREYEQFSYEELAEALDLSLNQVRVNLYRARKRFKEVSERSGKKFDRGENNGVE